MNLDFSFGDLSKSVNYQLSCNILPRCFFGTSISMDEIYKKGRRADIFYITALTMLVRRLGLIPSDDFEKPPIHFVKNANTKGFVIEIPEAKAECECNMVALLESDDGKRSYYTSEYYATSKKFGLCSFSPDGSHTAYQIFPKTLKEFVKAIGCKLD